MATARKRAKYSSPSVATLARRALAARPGYGRTAGYYGRFSGPAAELKFFDTALSFSFDNTGEVPATGQLSLIPQGVTESTRVGRKCTIRSIQIRGNISLVPAASATSASICYLYLVQDTQCNGAAAAVTDVLTSNAMQGALINMANSERFKILKRFVVVLEPQAGATTAYNNARKVVEYYKKCRIPIEFSSTTGAITEIRSNNLFLLAGDSGNDDVASFSGSCRLRFSDN